MIQGKVEVLGQNPVIAILSTTSPHGLASYQT